MNFNAAALRKMADAMQSGWRHAKWLTPCKIPARNVA
jgi:hypothetical protein